MDKKLRNVLIFGIIIISLSVSYYLVLKPVPSQKTEFDACYDKCLETRTDQDKNETCVHICGRNFSY